MHEMTPESVRFGHSVERCSKECQNVNGTCQPRCIKQCHVFPQECCLYLQEAVRSRVFLAGHQDSNVDGMDGEREREHARVTATEI